MQVHCFSCTLFVVVQVVLVLPDAWRAGFVSDTEGGRVWRDVALWFKQHFEESLGKIPGLLSFALCMCRALIPRKTPTSSARVPLSCYRLHN